MPDTSYITRSELDDALTQFRDETATLIANLVAEQLRKPDSGNGRAPSPPARTTASDATPILQGIASLKDEIVELRGEVRAEVQGLRGEVKADNADLRRDLKEEFNGLRMEFKGDIDSLRKEFKADVDGLRKGFKSDFEGLRAEFKGDFKGLRAEFKGDFDGLRTEVNSNVEGLHSQINSLRKDVKDDFGDLRKDGKADTDALRELRGELRIVKWMFGLTVVAVVGGLAILGQDFGRRIDGVRTELHASVSDLRSEMSAMRETIGEAIGRLVRLETLVVENAADASTKADERERHVGTED